MCGCFDPIILELTSRGSVWDVANTQECISELSVYGVLKTDDLITSPQCTALVAADKRQRPTVWRYGFLQMGVTYS